VKELTFTFESDTLASLFSDRLRLYLRLDCKRDDIHVTLMAHEIQVPEIERLARGSYASFKQVKDIPNPEGFK